MYQPCCKSMEVACLCWFPTKGQPFPISFKYKDEDGDIHSVKDIDILRTENVMQGKEFRCEALIGDQKRSFELMFFKDDCRWVLTMK